MATRPVEATDEAVAEFFGDVQSDPASLANRRCELQGYHKRRPRAIRITGEMIAYASPDSTYAVTRRLLQSAERSILIGIYDFTADHVKTLILAAMQRGVQVTLMLDLDGRTGERPLFDDLKRLGADAVPAPSCAFPVPDHRYFSSSHEKVIVVDQEWTLVQSGNYSNNSIPFNEVDGGDPARFIPGNRDCGVAIRSKRLATYLTTVLRDDIALLEGAAVHSLLRSTAATDATLLGEAPSDPPPQRFPSRDFVVADVRVMPVLTPDNYMSVVPPLLRSAQRSILIEQQYIRPHHLPIADLLTEIRSAMSSRPELDVRIILARPIGGKERDFDDIRVLDRDFGLTMGTHVRLLSAKHFVHCHNKLIVVDGTAVLVGSQNWSETAVLKNREASLLVEYPALATYYTELFDADWASAHQSLGRARRARLFEPSSFAQGNLVRLNPGDYDEV